MNPQGSSQEEATQDETELPGGNSTIVTRRGDTVRREAGPWTPAVHRLLSRLRDAGLSETPVPLGLDEQGREVLSYLPGVVGHYPLPDWLWEPRILREAGALLRRVHDASVPLLEEMRDEPVLWQSPVHEPVEVICHNDVASYNMVFQDGHLVGLIDFDTASPGPRLWDLAYLAYRLVPWVEDAGPAAPSAGQRMARLNELLNSYGVPYERDDVLRMMALRLDDLARFTDGRAAATGRPEFLDHALIYRRDRSAILHQLGA
ncbi:aminoglycoside phosphotransferase family protein [Psychromicrobium xiongbiense]|uniref:aminoglycoside phosphotransferase family protein n=1 Tax=Psychromicrobium xiongbiense TaxID=3051184 RepID=UPI0025561316|nr:aminoglycoside phosphotransferase family protein [Psychromicrobium sp. YIM S02556]